MLQVADFPGAVLVTAKNLRALVLKLRHSFLLVLVVLLQGRHSQSRVITLPKCRADRRQEPEIIVKLAQLDRALHSGCSTQTAQSHSRHTDTPRICGNDFGRRATLRILPASQAVLVLKLGHLDQRQPNVPKHIPHFLQPLHKILRLAGGISELNFKFNDTGVFSLQHALLFGQRGKLCRSFGVHGHRRLQLLQHTQEVVALLC
mmetsp:Transcript_15632/g.27712  ORF Transcript_15632/g.27712 Transcript_15632/m.27712 type:complete len:204 (+) Transcript_15632:340-951(+)